jgi:hypothetical protein
MDKNQKDQYLNRFKNIGLSQQQLEQKWRARLEEERMFEAASRQAALQIIGGGSAVGGGYSEGGPPPPPPGPESSGTITFNGTDQYVTAPNAQVTTWLPGTGPFTIEWFMKRAIGGAGAPRVFSLGFDTGATIGCSVEGGKVYIWPYGGSLNGTYPASYTAGSWMHVAICRDSSSDTRLYVDGILKMTATGDTRNINDSINPGFDLNMGVDNPVSFAPNWWAGKLTNFRWNNSAIYTGASLTIPTAPLTKDENTKLLMLGGTVDNPVFDSTYVNNLVNNGAVWDADTPFV